MPEQTITRENEIELLLEIANKGLKNSRSDGSSMQNRLQVNLSELLASPLFKDYILEEKGIKIIAVLFKKFLDGKEYMRAFDIIKLVEKDKKIALMEIKRLSRLTESGILEIVGNRSENTDGIGLIHSNIRLSDIFLDRLYKFDDKKETSHNTAEPYKDNYDYLCDHFERITILKEMKELNDSKGSRRQRDILAYNNLAEKLNKLEMRIEGRLNKTNKMFPLVELKKRVNLTRKEELIIIALLGENIVWENSYDIEDILSVISQTPYEKLTDRILLKEDTKLFKKKIIETESEKHIFRSRRAVTIKLNEKLKTKLLGDKKERKQKRGKLKNDSLYELVKPCVSLDNVILHPKTMEELDIAIEKVEGNTANLLQEWGIKNNPLHVKIGKNRMIRQSVIMLFYCPPGTGKTLAANAIAYKLKRDIITFDCSKILTLWVGESEQNTRKIFDRYREITEGMKNPPVLLLNEADQFLHRRVNVVKSTDNMYNQMQNIFLEQMEMFEGILIATTNLIENMDSAFSRRFHHKIEFRRPASNERFKLWQIHIPEKTPLADDVDLGYLSEHYDLSGGQIAVVVQNAATRAARRGDRIMMEDLINACDGEIKGNFDEKAKMRVGF